MNEIIQHRYYYSSFFAQYSNIFHGTTTKQFGPVDRDSSAIDTLCKEFSRQKRDCIIGQQIHGNLVKNVSLGDQGKAIDSVDGLVLMGTSKAKSLLLGVFTADCVPVFFYDPKESLIGICHAGWRGTHEKIVQKMVQECKKNGSDPKSLRVYLGPHIRSCSYDVPKARADLFKAGYGEDSSVITEFEGKLYLNLSEAIRIDLVREGIETSSIDHDSSPCTFCQSNEFYSYRKRVDNKMEEMFSFIGFR